MARDDRLGALSRIKEELAPTPVPPPVEVDAGEGSLESVIADLEGLMPVLEPDQQALVEEALGKLKEASGGGALEEAVEEPEVIPEEEGL